MVLAPHRIVIIENGVMEEASSWCIRLSELDDKLSKNAMSLFQF